MKDKIKNIDKKLFLTTVVLFGFGLIMIFSASSVTAYFQEVSPSYYFTRQLVIILISFLICVIFGMQIKTKNYKGYAWIALIVITCIVFATLIYSVAFNGAKGWIELPVVGTIQPSEFAKPIIIVWIGTMLGFSKDKELKNQVRNSLVVLIVSALIFFMIVLQKDYGTAIIFFIICAVMFFTSPVDKIIKKKIGLIGGTAGAFMIIVLTIIILNVPGFIDSDKLDRFNIKSPCERYLTTGNQICNGYIAINNGGLLGKGLGNSTQKYLYLPEAHTDFIYPIIVEETGIVGATFVLFLYFLLICRILSIAKKTTNNANRLICYGTITYILSHIIINLLGVTGVIPLTGVPLPFMSYGGSFAASLIVILTVVQRINYEENKKNRKKMA